MSKNEKTSKIIASLASKVLSGNINKRTITSQQLRKIAGSVLTQTRDKKK